jgi:hypothetical protein
MAKKLPLDISQMFNDSPIRSTEKVVAVMGMVAPPRAIELAHDPEVESEIEPELESELRSEFDEPPARLEVAPPLPELDEERDDAAIDEGQGRGVTLVEKKAPRALKKVAPAGWVKRTFYISKAQEDAIEAEVYHRRRRGSRIQGSDVVREILDSWVAARRKG